MKAVNRGKDFEGAIKKSLENLPNVSFDRLIDPMAGYSGVRNICDFTMFSSPDMFYLECKSKYGNTLNYAGDITKNQWIGMYEKSQIYRCVAGVCVWFMDHDVTAFVNIKDLQRHRNSGAKSLNITNLVTDSSNEDFIPHILIDGMKKRVMFDYFGDRFLHKLHQESDKIWSEYDGKINK